MRDQRHQSNVYNVMNAAAVISAGHKSSVTTQRPAETEPAQIAWLAKTRCAPPSPVKEADEDMSLDFHAVKMANTCVDWQISGAGQPGKGWPPIT